MSNPNINQLSLMSLFQVGTHRGNKKSKLNPRLKSKVFGYDKGLCLINLVDTKDSLDTASQLLYRLGQKNKQLLIVGTSKHLKDLTVSFAKSFTSAMPYVDTRWPGGTLTNYITIKKTLKALEKLQNIESNAEFFDKISKNQQLEIVREKEKKEKIFSGLVNLKNNRPGAVIVLDASENSIAIKEAEAVGIPVLALTNTSTVTLPKNLDYTILCNIHSIDAIKLILGELTNSYNKGSAVIIDSAEENKEIK
ncbi:MAG: 30S ribosomal protein S2 [candidate division SR1 bacterium]|nr:30S ribosomal protein S2 [candidate division SR1 bacterium]